MDKEEIEVPARTNYAAKKGIRLGDIMIELSKQLNQEPVTK